MRLWQFPLSGTAGAERLGTDRDRGRSLGLAREFPRIGPESVKGIEINPYAAELARVSVWIGEIQWMRRNGFGVCRNPILKPLEPSNAATQS